jgi:hypothetical protein
VMRKFAFLGLAAVILAGASFFAGLHWKDHEVGMQLTGALGTQLVCEASRLEEGVSVASLLDKGNSDDAKGILIIDIQSEAVKLKAFEPYLNQREQAVVTDALHDGENYLSTKRHP